MRSRSEPGPSDVAVLRALASGTLPGKQLLNAGLRYLAAGGFIDTASNPLPKLLSRSRLLLQVANGECTQPMD
jgi:hypothetical protein